MRQAAALIKRAARALTPAFARRCLFDLAHAFGMRAEPDRVFLERSIVPWLSGRARRTLFVGCRAYTAHYDLLFNQRGMTLWTMDIDPDAAAFGARDRHRIADATAPFAHLFPASFDAIVMNGVIGWGVDAPSMIENALRNVAAAAKPGAPVVIGWNTDRSVDPATLAVWAVLFQPLDGPTSHARNRFDNSTHVYDFARVRDDAKS